jgi:hypothetical protein
LLAFEDNKLILVQGLLDDGEVVRGDVFQVGVADFCAEGDFGAVDGLEFVDCDAGFDCH